MRRVTALVFLVACAQASEIPHLKPQRLVSPTPNDQRIVGGELAKDGQFPWQVLFIADGVTFCAGSLVAPDVVLTSAWCIAKYENFTVHIGSVKYWSNGEPGAVRIETSTKIVHEKYNSKLYDFNIGLLILPRQLTMNEYVNIVNLPTYSMLSEEFEGVEATVTGWGDPENNSTSNDYLHYVAMPVMTNYECHKSFGKRIRNSVMCTDTKNGHSACYGDLGSALVHEVNGRNIQIGIMSFYKPPCIFGLPVAFTRVTSFLKWIEVNAGITIRPS